ncbi:methylated-DNA--[protein]-cysteine S-methyltransferase [Sandaracinobacteroides saxicola]|uniref:Methylated-DNA--protein-cysteine methyltransferase n=1 Tax=Sandaracinobacteroides saxicola TaxID=2759707 RepID=A0A7G5IMD7_9SPHN|nr:methylated-DNA--[protein]-cysteine S-methyltransferase [Sandaracinobacteroides saxicola]
MLSARIDTPVGPMILVHDGATLFAAEFHEDAARIGVSLKRFGLGPVAEATAVPEWLGEAFAAYFAGALTALEGLPTARHFGSDFERAVWAELRRIPAGETRSYGAVARALGSPATGDGGLARAVGTANGRNPLAIVVPCHRVIGADGSLTGYAGGLHRKRWLLAHEGSLVEQPRLL